MTRSAVRSRLAPPAFACFASYGSASHAAAHRSEASEGCRVVARRAKTGLGKLHRSQDGLKPLAYFPVNLGGRFSIKLATPSRKSLQRSATAISRLASIVASARG